jgi:hypothetical protein
MKPPSQHWLDNRTNIKWLLRAFYVICAGLLLLDSIHHRHVYHDWERLWGFYGVYGFVACTLLVLIAKQMRKLLMRRKDYYDDR